METLALYLHWPFCQSKCPYCDFASTPSQDVREAESGWVQKILVEMQAVRERSGAREITSIYFGGGTPSLLSPASVESVIKKSADLWKVAEACEITLEANPCSSDGEKFAAFRAAGVNRLSLGVQALKDADLKFLGRLHSAAEARQAIEKAQKIFPRFSFDLIYARRGQTIDAWKAELREALAFGTKHVSLYQLTIEEGTAFGRRAAAGENLVAGGEADAFLNETYDAMEKAGLPFYEISNFAAKGEESRHNLAYWNYEDYAGLGPAAHGRLTLGGKKHATEKTRNFADWLAGAGDSEEVLSAEEAKREALLMGLRLRVGISLAAWREKFGEDLVVGVGAEKIARAEEEGLIEVRPTHLAATREGLVRLNALIKFLVA